MYSLPQLPVGQKDFKEPNSRESTPKWSKQKLGREDLNQLLSLEESPAGN